jgi:hypothetical protein
MGSQIKGAVAAGATAIAAALQCVLAFTTFGSRLSSERALIIYGSAAAAMIAIAFWSVTAEGDVRRRRIVGSIGLVVTLAFGLVAQWATLTYHNILTMSRSAGTKTTTTVRGPLAPVDVEIGFSTEPGTSIEFAGYDGTTVTARTMIERRSDWEFMLHRLGSDELVVLHHVSGKPLKLEMSEDHTTAQEIRREMLKPALAGGVLCGGGVLLVFWLTSLQRSRESPARPIGFSIGEK